MIASILASDVRLSVRDGKLSIKGSPDVVKSLAPTIKRWKPELLKVLAGETICDVGDCDQCEAELLGLLVHGGYTNRVCPECDKWFRCLPPMEAKPEILVTSTDLVCNSQPIPLF